jgi:ABC-type multidrug transport system ATPase subunit
MTTLLVADRLSFSFGSTHVFTMWSAELPAGLTWLQGPNGSGKSTLLKLLAGALEPFTGRRVAAGVDAAAEPLAYRRNVFWCGPGAPAFDHLRPPEFFGFMATLYPSWSPAALADAVQGFGLDAFLGTRLSQLSTGNQRKAWLAAALAAGTPAVLLDEPFNALDAAALRWLRAALRRHADAATQAWLVASHEAPLPGEGARLELAPR